MTNGQQALRKKLDRILDMHLYDHIFHKYAQNSTLRSPDAINRFEKHYKYFNNIFQCNKKLLRNPPKIKIKRAVLGRLRAKEKCTAEEKMVSNLSLKNIVLQYLHKAFKFSNFHQYNKFIFNYAQQPELIESLPIPFSLKKELAQLYYNCSRHYKGYYLRDAKVDFFPKYVLLPGSPAEKILKEYHFLQEEEIATLLNVPFNSEQILRYLRSCRLLPSSALSVYYTCLESFKTIYFSEH